MIGMKPENTTTTKEQHFRNCLEILLRYFFYFEIRKNENIKITYIILRFTDLYQSLFGEILVKLESGWPFLMMENSLLSVTTTHPGT